MIFRSRVRLVCLTFRFHCPANRLQVCCQWYVLVLDDTKHFLVSQSGEAQPRYRQTREKVALRTGRERDTPAPCSHLYSVAGCKKTPLDVPSLPQTILCNRPSIRKSVNLQGPCEYKGPLRPCPAHDLIRNMPGGDSCKPVSDLAIPASKYSNAQDHYP